MNKLRTGPRGGKYRNVNGKKVYYCGSAGGVAKNKFPVNTEKRCRAALSYSRFAKRPCGIVSCALKQAAKHGWKCGTSSAGAKKCGCNKKGKCSKI